MSLSPKAKREKREKKTYELFLPDPQQPKGRLRLGTFEGHTPGEAAKKACNRHCDKTNDFFLRELGTTKAHVYRGERRTMTQAELANRSEFAKAKNMTHVTVVSKIPGRIEVLQK